jgi:hypothetical protein
MDHVPGLQASPGGNLGITGCASTHLAALGQDRRSPGPVDGAIHATSAQERAFGCVYDGIRILICYVAFY